MNESINFSLLVTEYLQDEIWDVTTDGQQQAAVSKPGSDGSSRALLQVTTATRMSANLKTINSNIQQVCLLLGGIANCAKVSLTKMEFLSPTISKGSLETSINISLVSRFRCPERGSRII